MPMLYLGNPGIGKTTIVNLWAKRNGYHVESLIGSAFDRSEILGYMVNDGGEYLKTKDPEWFHSIIENEKNGVPSVLFIDEIAGAPKDVQASLYRLIFERTIGNGHSLPESTIIASASNYKANLPVMCDITSPNINRFCVVNLCPVSFEGLYSEFLQEECALEENLPVFDNKPVSEELNRQISAAVYGIFENINTAYCAKDSSKGLFDYTNKNLNNIFDADYSTSGEVYNFISGRTISYYKAVFRAMYIIGLKNKAYIGKFVDGLIGLGFNTFPEIKELNAYRRFILELTKTELSKLDNSADEETPVKLEFKDDDSISKMVHAVMLQKDKLGLINLQDVMSEIYLKIVYTFSDKTEEIYDFLVDNTSDVSKTAAFREDYESIKLFRNIIEESRDTKERDVMLKTIDDIILTYRFYALSCI